MLGDEGPEPAQQSCQLDAAASQTPVGKETSHTGQHSPTCRFQGRSVDLVPQDRHLVAQHDNLDGEIGVTAADESHELEDATERPVLE